MSTLAAETWLPTPENINALPASVRDYIHGLEANADPAGMVRENVQLRDANRGLQKMYRSIADKLDTPGNRNPEARYRGYKGESLGENATDDERAAWEEGRRAATATDDKRTCEHCCGSGKVKHDDFNPTQSNCPHCDGEGVK